MKHVAYHPDNSTVSIEPGARWYDVYPVLDKVGVAVVGGRAGHVGTAGFFLGGGNSLYSARKGMACDSILRFEVVLASGEVISVDKSTNTDLFVALKGGSSNFGIVTRFDLEAFESKQLWAGVVLYPQTASEALIEAFVPFGNSLDAGVDDSSTIIFQSYIPEFKDIIWFAQYANIDGVEWDEPHKDFWAIQPNISSTLRFTNITDLTSDLALPLGLE